MAAGRPLDPVAVGGALSATDTRRRDAAAPHAAPGSTVLARRIGHAFRSPELLTRALLHRSAGGARDSNERLEFLGDRVLGLLIAEWLSERFPREREGDLGKRLAVLVARDTLAGIATRLDFGAALHVAAAGDALRGRQNILADALEAVIGALYLDGGLETARAFVRREWAAALDATRRPPVSAKSRLQEWLAGRALPAPVYRVTGTEGPSHEPLFTIEVAAEGRTGLGSGPTKQAAEQAAAAAWLAELP